MNKIITRASFCAIACIVALCAQIPEATTGFQFPITETTVGWPFPQSPDDKATGYKCGWVYHPGRDMNAATCCGNISTTGDRDLGTPVLAAATGRVVYVDVTTWGGVVIQHSYKGETFYTEYGHVRNVLVAVGDVVDKGVQIAEVGKKGTKSAHLHFEVRTAVHPDPIHGAYWQTCGRATDPRYLVLQSYQNVRRWYEDPVGFITSHPPYNSNPNQPPTAGFLMSAQGKNATQGQTLNLVVPSGAVQVVDFNALPPRSTDPDGDSTIASYEWRSNGTRIPTSSFTGGVMQFGFGVGTHVISLIVKDNLDAASPVAQGTIVVTANKAPVIASTPPSTSMVGQPYSYQVAAQDPENGSLTYSLTIAPSGMTISQTGLIQWQPTASQTGSNPVTVRVTDPFLLFATQSFNVDVVAGSIRMKEARAEFAASSLNSGFVLVTGGGIGGGILSNTAELYDPTTATWRYTWHSMNATRSAHTSTRLSDGRVLIVGGLGSAAGSAEIFDPATETFILTPPMNSAHIKHAAVLLNDGRVLVMGGGDVDGYTILATTEIYNPASNSWILAAPLPVPARRHDAVLLADGTVLSAGGSGYLGECCFPNASVHRYNPANNTWRTMVPMLVPRLDHTLTLLPNGKVLIAGGTNTTATVKSTEIYDPTAAPSGQTQFGPDLLSDCRGHTATRLANGDVLVAGGFSSLLIQGSSTFPPLAQLYRYATNSWSSTAILPRSYHTASVLSNGDVLLAGGVDANGVTNTSEIWKSGP